MDESKGYKFIDLFAGIGGFRIALEQLGCQCVFSSEWDKFCQQTYLANFLKFLFLIIKPINNLVMLLFHLLLKILQIK